MIRLSQLIFCHSFGYFAVTSQIMWIMNKRSGSTCAQTFMQTDKEVFAALAVECRGAASGGPNLEIEDPRVTTIFR